MWNIPEICLRTFSKIEYNAQNGVANYPSLWETETLFGFGKYIKTLLHTFADSSSSKPKQVLLNLKI